MIVTSRPEGADIYVMGEKVGTTPGEVTISAIFPNVYPRDKEPLYGQVVLRRSGCEEFRTSVSVEKLARGIDAKLQCDTGSVAHDSSGQLRERLRRLDDLRRDGVINEEEYRRQRERILGEL